MKILLLHFFIGFSTACFSEAMVDPSGTTTPDTALLIIDVQNFYFAGGKLPLTKPVEAGLQARELLERFRARKMPIFHVRHLPARKEGSPPRTEDPQYAIHASVAPLAGEKVIVKHEVNSFRDTSLLPELKSAGIRKLVLCGMQTHMCVEAAVRAAVDFGFEVTLASDACATRALSFEGREIPAETVQAVTLAVLHRSYARVMTTAAILAELP